MSGLWNKALNLMKNNNAVMDGPRHPQSRTDSENERNITRIVKEASKTPSKVWAWRVVIAVLFISLVTFIIWFDNTPESFSYSNGIGKTPSEHRLNGIYYWCTVTSTVGFGDICPITPTAKGVTSLYQIFITLLSLGVIWNITDDHVKKLVTREQRDNRD